MMVPVRRVGPLPRCACGYGCCALEGMVVRNYENEILFATLRTFALTVAELYTTYAYVFFPESDRWIRMAEQEKRYAHWLSILRECSTGNAVFGQQTARALHSASQAVEFVRSRIEEAENGRVNLVQALIVALEVENLVFERFFPPCHCMDQQAVQLRREVVREVRERRERLEAWLDRVHNKKFLAA